MATIDLGKIKLVWRGTYAGGTAYTVDDVVSHTDSGIVSSYICTTNSTGNAPSTGGSVHGSWAYLAKGASAYTSTLTTQGDILYRDGSGEARLGYGTAGQVLQTGGSGANPSWTTMSSDFVKVVTATGGGTSALALDSCFSADYENYLIIANINTDATTGVSIRMQNASNTEQSGSDYFYAGVQIYRNSSSHGQDYKVGWGSGEISMQESISAGSGRFGQYIIYVNRPFLSTTKTNLSIDFHSYDGSNFRTVKTAGTFDTAQSNAGIRFFTGSGNITNVSKVSVYGFKQ